MRRCARTCIASFVRHAGPGSGFRPPKASMRCARWSQVGFADRGILRDTFLLTLAKTPGREARARRAALICSSASLSRRRIEPRRTRREDPEKTGSGHGIRRTPATPAAQPIENDNLRPAGADAAVAGPQRTVGCDRQRRRRARRCPISATSPSAASFRPHPRCRWASSACATISTI